MKLALALSFGLLCPAFGVATAADRPGSFDLHLRSPGPRQQRPFTVQPSSLKSGTFAQATDHSGLLPGQTFAQRYWYDSEYATRSDAPVLYHICGEGDVDDAYFLDDYALEWAKELGARVVFLEHRYYGRSQPFADLSTPHMQYLTLNNVLEDLASFQRWTMASQGWTGPWIALGGSYSATLAALYRQQHPELVVGALASSAPMVSGIGEATGTAWDVARLASTNPSANDGERPWAYQACTELGYWQAEGGERGAPLDLPSRWLCQQVFGAAPFYNSDAYNQAYDLPFIAADDKAPSNILFTYGSDDVWTDTGLAQQKNLNPNIVVKIIDGAGHHFDLNAPSDDDSPAVIAARSEFTALAKAWLSGDEAAQRPAGSP